MVPVLCAAAFAVLWWPTTRAEYRLTQLQPTARRPGTPHWKWVVLPLISFVAMSFGIEVTVAAGMLAGVVLWRDSRRRRRLVGEQADADLLTALSIMIAEMSVGALVATACAAAAAELCRIKPDSAVAQELSSLAGRAALGGRITVSGMNETSGGPGTAVWHRIGTAWQLSDQHGLPMIDLLVAVRADLLAQNAFDARTRAGLAGPRATATVLAGLPALGIALGQATGADPVGVLTGGGLGGLLLIVGTALVVAGLCWSDRIVERVSAR